MAENEYCVARRTYTDGKPAITFVDHHEWRYMMLAGEPDSAPYYLYYCVFCLRLEKRKVEDGA